MCSVCRRASRGERHTGWTDPLGAWERMWEGEVDRQRACSPSEARALRLALECGRARPWLGGREVGGWARLRFDRLWRHCPALAPVGGMGPIGGRRRVCGTREAILGYPNRDPRLVPSVHTRHGRRTALFEKPNSKGVWCVSRSISKYFRRSSAHNHTRLVNISETLDVQTYDMEGDSLAGSRA